MTRRIRTIKLTPAERMMIRAAMAFWDDWCNPFLDRKRPIEENFDASDAIKDNIMDKLKEGKR